jgi:hypothetical protein
LFPEARIFHPSGETTADQHLFPEARIFQPSGKTTADQPPFPRPGYFNLLAKQQLISICFRGPDISTLWQNNS